MALNEVKTMNDHAATRAWEARLLRIEQSLSDMAASSEQRVLALRDAVAEYVAGELAERDREIATLNKTVADLELRQKTAVASATASLQKRCDALEAELKEFKAEARRQAERNAELERRKAPPVSRPVSTSSPSAIVRKS